MDIFTTQTLLIGFSSFYLSRFMYAICMHAWMHVCKSVCMCACVHITCLLISYYDEITRAIGGLNDVNIVVIVPLSGVVSLTTNRLLCGLYVNVVCLPAFVCIAPTEKVAKLYYPSADIYNFSASFIPLALISSALLLWLLLLLLLLLGFWMVQKKVFGFSLLLLLLCADEDEEEK